MASHLWKAKAGADEVPRLRHAVADYVAGHGVCNRLLEDMSLAVSEVVTNAVLHAYPHGAEGDIVVVATVEGDEVTVRVVDEGIGTAPRIGSPGAGLGLLIAGRIAQRMVVEHPLHGGTDVRMTFLRTG
jgi:anti-sigma regulatory factor (Ser/Thr protein kinase)